MTSVFENFSSICRLIQAQNLHHQTLKIIFLVPSYNIKERIMCMGCVNHYGGNKGDILPFAALPASVKKTGEAYLLCHEYPVLQQLLKQQNIDFNLEIHLATLDNFSTSKGQVFLEKSLKLTPHRMNLETFMQTADHMLWSPEKKHHFIHLQTLFHISDNTEKIKIDHRTIVHFAHYERLSQNVKKTMRASLLALSKRAILVDTDIARTMADFPIENGLDLALAIAPHYMPNFLVRTHDPQKAIDFISKHRNVTLSMQDIKKNPIYLEFDFDKIPTEQHQEALDEYLACFMGKIAGVNNRHAHLYQNLPTNMFSPAYHAVIYDQRLLSMNLMSFDGVHKKPFMPPKPAWHPLEEIRRQLVCLLPYRYFGIDYRLMPDSSGKLCFVLRAIHVLKTQELSQILFYAKAYQKNMQVFHAMMPSPYAEGTTPYIFDQVVCSQIRNALIHDTRLAMMA